MGMNIYLKEKIGNPNLFTGRQKELTLFLKWIDGIMSMSGPTKPPARINMPSGLIFLLALLRPFDRLRVSQAQDRLIQLLVKSKTVIRRHSPLLKPLNSSKKPRHCRNWNRSTKLCCLSFPATASPKTPSPIFRNTASPTATTNAGRGKKVS